MITELIVGVAVVLGTTVGLAAPASADTVFNHLTCTCGAPPPLASPLVADRINQGLLDAETRQLPGD
jgi:hypothetical protein